MIRKTFLGHLAELKFLGMSFLIIICSSIPLLAEGWKFRIGMTQHDLFLKDLESPLDFWNYAIRSVMVNKNKDYGLNLPLPKEMKGVSKSNGFYFNLERRVFSFIFLGIGGELEHTSYQDYDRLEGVDETGGRYDVSYNYQDSLDNISPFLQLSAYPLKLKYIKGGFYFRSLLNLAKLSGKSLMKLHLMNEDGSITRALMKGSTSLDSFVLFPSFEGDFEYNMDAESTYHPPVHEHIKESGKVWVGESLFEAGGYTY